MAYATFKSVVWVSVEMSEENMRHFNTWLILNKIYPAVVGGGSGPTYMGMAYMPEDAEKIKSFLQGCRWG
jgi:hypothetical protein